MGPMYANIPDQYGASWSEASTTPNTNSYQMFWQRGYAVIENLAVNMIIAEDTGVDTSSLALMAIPMQSNDAVVDSFASVLQQLFPFMILLMFIPPVYNSVYLIV